MAMLRIDVKEVGKPSATITIPLWLANAAAVILPDTAKKNLRDQIDIDLILKVAHDPNAHGLLLEVEDHTDGEKVTISLMGGE